MLGEGEGSYASTSSVSTWKYAISNGLVSHSSVVRGKGAVCVWGGVGGGI